MSTSVIIFYAIAALILGAGIAAVTTTKIFRSAIWLLFSLIGVAALYFWMQVEFIAAIQIVVYVGGIVVLIIFSIFLTHQSGKELPHANSKRTLFSALAAILGAAFVLNILNHYEFSAVTGQAFNPSIASIGMQMLNTTGDSYLLPFEAVSMLLLGAMIGCIVIAMKPSTSQNNLN